LGAYSIRWPDYFKSLLLEGAAPLGPQSLFGIFRNKDVTANAIMCDLLASGRSLVASILNRAPPPDEQRNAIWTKSCEEQQKGWLSEWMTFLDLDALFGEGQWSPVVRFALWQNGK
jgi:hypothetical protein